MTVMPIEENEAPPAAFGHIMSVWNTMCADATPTSEGLVYEGYMTKLITKQLNLAIPYYTLVTQAFKGMNCAKQLQRGGGNSKSRWLLKKEPTLETYLAWEEERRNSKRSDSVSKTAVQLQMIQDLDSRIETLESALAELIDALKD